MNTAKIQGDISSQRIPVTWMYGQRYVFGNGKSGQKNKDGIVVTPTTLFSEQASSEDCYTWSRYGPVRNGNAVFGCTGCRKIRDADRRKPNDPTKNLTVPTVLVDLSSDQPFFKRLILPAHRHFCQPQKIVDCQGKDLLRMEREKALSLKNVSKLQTEWSSTQFTNNIITKYKESKAKPENMKAIEKLAFNNKESVRKIMERAQKRKHSSDEDPALKRYITPNEFLYMIVQTLPFK